LKRQRYKLRSTSLYPHRSRASQLSQKSDPDTPLAFRLVVYLAFPTCLQSFVCSPTTLPQGFLLAHKGVLNVEDAAGLKKAGVDGIQVSSHGARQLESAPTPIEMLPQIRTEVGPDFPLFFDSGIRSGEDVLRALHQGADFVFLGRILQFAIAAGGEPGLHRLWNILSDEMSIAMAQTGQALLDTNPTPSLGQAIIP
jgi:hypothetical protein